MVLIGKALAGSVGWDGRSVGWSVGGTVDRSDGRSLGCFVFCRFLLGSCAGISGEWPWPWPFCFFGFKNALINPTRKNHLKR